MRHASGYLALAVVSIGVSMAGCAHHASAAASDWRRIATGKTAGLLVRTEGGAGVHTSESSNVAGEGETIHRILRSADGKAIFAYDVLIEATEDNREYRIRLLPAEFGVSTFRTAREVVARADEDLVRVDLMEQPETHEKIVDVYRLMANPKQVHEVSFKLMEIHNAVFRWFHGL